MKKLTEKEYLTFVKPFIDETRFNLLHKEDSWLDKVLLLFKNEIEYGQQINHHLDLFFNEITLSGETQAQLASLGNFEKLIKTLVNDLKEVSDNE
jgi:hypothetical protein